MDKSEMKTSQKIRGRCKREKAEANEKEKEVWREKEKGKKGK